MAVETRKQAANDPALPGRAVRKSLPSALRFGMRRKNLSSQAAAVRPDKASRRTVFRPPLIESLPDEPVQVSAQLVGDRRAAETLENGGGRTRQVSYPHEVNIAADRLVTALVVMVQQAHRNRLRDAGTLDPSSKRRTA
jgi:hypothetical protein